MRRIASATASQPDAYSSPSPSPTPPPRRELDHTHSRSPERTSFKREHERGRFPAVDDDYDRRRLRDSRSNEPRGLRHIPSRIDEERPDAGTGPGTSQLHDEQYYAASGAKDPATVSERNTSSRRGSVTRERDRNRDRGHAPSVRSHRIEFSTDGRGRRRDSLDREAKYGPTPSEKTARSGIPLDTIGHDTKDSRGHPREGMYRVFGAHCVDWTFLFS